MFEPNKDEIDLCKRIVYELVDENDNYDTNSIIREIFNIAYSIGGSYKEDFLREVAKVVISNK